MKEKHFWIWKLKAHELGYNTKRGNIYKLPIYSVDGLGNIRHYKNTEEALIYILKGGIFYAFDTEDKVKEFEGNEIKNEEHRVWADKAIKSSLTGKILYAHNRLWKYEKNYDFLDFVQKNAKIRDFTLAYYDSPGYIYNSSLCTQQMPDPEYRYLEDFYTEKTYDNEETYEGDIEDALLY